MDLIFLLALAVAAVILVIVLAIFKKKVKNEEQVQLPENQRQVPVPPGARRRALVANRNTRSRQRIVEEDQDAHVQESLPTSDIPEGKMGAKKLAKLQAKAEKRALREAEEKIREEKQKAQEKADEERRIQEEKEKEDERKREEKERREREERERKEYEEYLKLKEEFSIQEEGYEEDEEESKNILQDFLNYIKENKVVVLEDIAAHFNLKTQNVIERVQQLQASGSLTGVIDDRGKFIYISEQELETVAKFVKQRGRVSIVELVENSNRLINLAPNIRASA